MIAKWDFEDTAVTDPAGYQNVSAPNGWFNVSDYAERTTSAAMRRRWRLRDDTTGALTGYGAGEHQWLDTAASPGNIWIQLSEANRTTNLAADQEAKLTFSVAKQSFGDGSGGANGGANSHTDANATVEFWWNDELVKTVKAADLATDNHFYEFSAVVHGNDALATDQLFIKSSGTDTTAQGLAIDHIVLQDWIV